MNLVLSSDSKDVKKGKRFRLRLNDTDANAIFGTIGTVGLSRRRSVLFRD